MHSETLLTCLMFFFAHKASCSCYFPVEVQGEFLTQSMVDQEIAYSTVSILYNSIPGWGECHSRHGARILLEDETVNGETCFKCVRLAARSKNVIQIHTRDLYQCFSSEQEALSSCPSVNDVIERKVKEIMLFKTRGFYGESAISEVLCPIHGKWRFTYTNRGDEDSSCASPASRAGNCPTGYKFDLQFRGCSFPNKDMHFKCIGNWQGDDGQQYLALLDTKLPQLGEELKPRYRCGIFKSDLSRGYTWLALSNDSTCTHQLFSHSAGYETLQLHSLKQPQRVSRSYSLPKWAQGEWGSVSIHGGHLIYKSEEQFTTYSAATISSPRPNSYLVRLKTSCGHATYACIELEQRTENIIELRIGEQGKSSHQELCNPDKFVDKEWITLGRNNVRSTCPLVGEYSGALPDAEGLCARSVTSCDHPDQMSYQVYSCSNTTEVFEDRSYHCYGGFQEGGLVYTVVKRLDLPHRECFVGVRTDDGGSKITEAGASCGRNKDPATDGMLLSFNSANCVEWKWEEVTTVVTLEDNNETLNERMTIRPEMAIEPATTKLPVVLKEFDNQITHTNLEPDETKNATNQVMNENIKRVNSSSKGAPLSSAQILHSIVILSCFWTNFRFSILI